jgi:hypothetical protein
MIFKHQKAPDAKALGAEVSYSNERDGHGAIALCSVHIPLPFLAKVVTNYCGGRPDLAERKTLASQLRDSVGFSPTSPVTIGQS